MFNLFKKSKPDKWQSLKLELEKKKQENKKVQKKLVKIASRNNSGIDLEKSGKIDDAIIVYEENVNDNVVATHSYDRLMIIYRRRKNYINEIRIIKTAIDVFSKENEIRYQLALKKTNDSELERKIQMAHKNGENVRGNDGWIIYNPYPVKKYQARLEKAIKLNEKSKK